MNFVKILRVLFVQLLVCLLLCLLLTIHPQANAQTDASVDANMAHPHYIVTAKRGDYSIAGLVTHLQATTKFKHGIVLFPGSPGILRLREEDGKIRFNQGGNFLVRTRRHWLDNETLVLVIDAPSDKWGMFSHYFREEPRYGQDVAALLNEVAQRTPVEDWTFVGTSEGSVSAYHATRMNPKLASRTILTSSLMEATNGGSGLSWVKWANFPVPLLWVHHENDPCPYASYRAAKAFSKKSNAPLLTAQGGGPARGDACDPYTGHGYVGMEREVVLAMRSWINTGVVPETVVK